MSAGDTVAVVMPTVPGREAELEEVVARYHATAPTARIVIERGHATVGAGWTAGVERLVREADEGGRPLPRYVLLSNDDVRPHPGWLRPAVEAVEGGFTPCPVCYRPDGSVESAGRWEAEPVDWAATEWTPLCFFRTLDWSMVGPIPPIHYYSDNWFSTASIYRAARPIRVRTGFAFTHTWAMPGRQRMDGVEAQAAQRIWHTFREQCEREYGPVAR